ncbi:hypothetical protein HHE94_18245 [Pseudoalteromonas arctica]|uniref:Uncharacterized protein n=1 Tax=Pseudoalteromonas arctica TaxID=394751 RepID=A0AAP6Y5W9_9GAMM|nr:hypothetical protein [Pseudoalteromonas arctica]NMP04646.1 hypothetical protein [Pseudoalteromonas arctica]
MSIEFFNFETLGQAASIIAISISALAGFATSMSSKKGREKANSEINELASSPEKDSRLLEIKAELKRQQSIAKWQGFSATSLTFSQYIVGGVLTTSFIQDTLSSQIVGLLGLLVLISSLIHQHFRPDLKSRFAKERIVILRSLVRSVEDQLFAIVKEKSEPESIHNIRTQVSKTLKDIESSELQDLGKIEAETST